MKDATLKIRVDRDEQQGAEQVLAYIGMTMSQAVNMFIRRINLVKGLPFEASVPDVEQMNRDIELKRILDEIETERSSGNVKLIPHAEVVARSQELLERLQSKAKACVNG